MKIEKHNSHGMQLLVMMTPGETRELIAKLSKVAGMVERTEINHYVTIPCQFEDDNDRYVATDFTILLEGNPVKSEREGSQAAYPCGKPVERMGSIPDGPCDMQEGHEWGCYRRNAVPQF